MNFNKRKGFTIVELVIVIAVIAILAAVLIPTFSNVIKDAKINSDKLTENQLNTGIQAYTETHRGGINNVSDLRKAIDSVFHDGYFDSLTPKSAEYGYHFWYNLAENRIYLLSAEEYAAIEDKTETASAFNFLNGAEADALNGDKIINTSYMDRAASFTKGFFLIDAPTEDNDLAYILGNLGRNDMDSTVYAKILEKVNALGEHKHDKHHLTGIKDLLESTAFITKNGTFRQSAVEEVKEVVIADYAADDGVIELRGGVYSFDKDTYELSDSADYEANSANISDGTIILHELVGKVESGALNFAGEANVTVQINCSEEQLCGLMGPAATNATIKLTVELECTYKVVDTEIEKYDKDGALEETLQTTGGNMVDSFDVSVSPNLFYAADALPESIEITADNFVGVDPERPVSYTKLVWESSDDNIATVVDGVVEFTDAAKGADKVEITARAVYSENITQKITINIVRITNFQLNIAEIKGECTAADLASYTQQLTVTGFNCNYPGSEQAEQCDKTLTYSSNNANVAVDENGKVTFADFVDNATITVALKSNPAVKLEIPVTLNETITDVLENKWNGNFLYRVGNGNAFSLSNIFAIKSDVNISGITYSFKVYDAAKTTNGGATKVEVTSSGSFNGTATGTGLDATYKFGGTGVAIIEMTAQKNGKTIQTVAQAVEVVNGKNATTYTDISGHGSNSVVMLCDVDMAEGGKLNFSNSSLYGNGFTLDATKAKHTSSGGISENTVIKLGNNAHIDNIEIVGAVYTEYGTLAASDYNSSLVCIDATADGTATISNSVLSNCASPVRIFSGNVTIKNTVLEGGCFANLDIRRGNITLDNVTTVNNAVDNDKAANGNTVVGLGIVVYYENVDPNTKITLKNDLKQFNYINKDDQNNIVPNDYTELIFDKVFSISETDDFKIYHTDDNGVKWVNSGIFSISGDIVNSNNIDITSFGKKNDYAGKSETFSVLGTSANTYMYLPKAAAPTNYDGSHNDAYEVIKPAFTADFSGQSIPKVDGALKYFYTDSLGIHIGVSAGNNVTFDFLSNAIFSKYGSDIVTNVKYDNTDISSKEFTVSDQGVHTLTYTVTDNTFYDKNGSAISDSKTYTETLTIYVEIASWKSAEITVTPGTVYWETVNFNDYNACIPVASGIVIKDYAMDGTESNITSDGKTMPAGVTYEIIQNGWPNFANGSTTENNSKDGLFYIKTTNAANNKGDATYVIKFTYTGANGVAVTTTATYTFSTSTGSYPTKACITPETLITLADGTQVQVKNLNGTEQLLVWNHETGKLDTAPVAYIAGHNGVEEEQEILTLVFDNGSSIEIIGNHVFFDITENKYVGIDSSNVDGFLGHSFAMLGENDLNSAKLVGTSSEIRVTKVYEIGSYKNVTCFTNNILSAAAYLDVLLNAIDVDAETLAYDMEQLEKDIAEYGLFTYADFEGIIPEAAFEMYNMQYFKIAIAKGYITWDGILAMADIYHSIGITPLN